MSSRPAAVNVTQCPLCTEVLTNPRQLPCIHSFCLKCLESRRGFESCQTASCPVCAAQWVVPEGGVDRLPRDRFIEKLIDVRKISSALDSKAAGCDVCEDQTRAAASFCIECQQRVCDQCAAMHRRVKATSDHRLLDLAAGLRPDDLRQLTTLPASKCDVHETEAIKVYCSDCRAACCMLCHLDRHNHHNCTDVTKVTNDLRRRIKDDINALADDVGKVRVESLRVQRGQAELNKIAERVRGQVSERAEQLKRLIDDQTRQLMMELDSVKAERRNEVEVVESVIGRHQAALESFIEYSELMFDQGTASDVASVAEQLHSRANQLQAFDVNNHVNNNLTDVDVLFSRSDVDNALSNLVGRLTVNKQQQRPVQSAGWSAPVQEAVSPPAPLPTSPPVPAPIPLPPVSAAAAAVVVAADDVIPAAPGTEVPPVAAGFQLTVAAQPVLGITSIDNSELFVVRHKTSEVEVYDSTTLTIKRQIAVPGLGSWPYGLAGCRLNRCIYVSDFVNNAVHRVDAGGVQAATRWSVAGGPAGLCVAGDCSVFVACSTSLKIFVFTTQGALVSELSVPGELAGLSHVVTLSSGQLVVSHGAVSGQLQRVCLLDRPPDTPAADTPHEGEDSATGAAEKPHRKKMLTIRRHETKSMSVKTTADQQKPAAAEAKILLSFGGAAGGGERQLHCPKALQVTESGHVIVADRDNNRVVSMDAELRVARDLTRPIAELQLQGPRCLWLDEARRRLYVGEETGCRIVAIDNVKVLDD